MILFYRFSLNTARIIQCVETGNMSHWKTSLLLLAFSSCVLSYDHVITIDGSIGQDTASCISGGVPCKTLSWAFHINHRKNSTQYTLEKGTHYLNATTKIFEGLSDLSFNGQETGVVVYCTEGETGLAFTRITNLQFYNLIFYNCSAQRNSTTRNYHTAKERELPISLYTFQVGLYFYQCTNVLMSFVNVTHSPSAMGVMMFDTNGTNEFNDSVFENNKIGYPVENTTSRYGGGGGFYVEFSYCQPGDTNCSNVETTAEPTITGAIYYFKRCRFLQNQANISDYDKSTYIVPYQIDHGAFGRGGGLSIFVKGSSNGNYFEVLNCTFQDNQALWGAGMFLEFHDHTKNNTAYIDNSQFLNNSCSYTKQSGTAGGGMRIGHYVYFDNFGPGNNVTIENCDFSFNSALNGGGISISSTLQNQSDLTTISLSFCNFVENVARLGSALHVDGFPLILFGQMLSVFVKHSNITGNSVEFLKPLNLEHEPYQVGVGTVYVHKVPLKFRGNMTFAGNTGSALAAVKTVVSFSNCTAFFRNNTGNKGGGIALLGAAYIMVNQSTNLQFYNNSAVIHGGAIYNQYISRENMNSYTHCFIRHENPFLHPDEWNATFHFDNNADFEGSRPSAVYSTSILPCSWAGGSGVNRTKSAILCWHGWTYEDSEGCAKYIHTDIGSITFVEGSNHVKAFPGWQFDLGINIVDDLNKDIDKESVFVASTKASLSSSALGVNGTPYSFIWGEKTTVWGNNSEAQPQIILALDSDKNRVWHLEIIIELQPCPPGFKLGDKEIGGKHVYTTTDHDVQDQSDIKLLSCRCTDTYAGAVSCNENTFTAELRNGNWMGTINNKTGYYTSLCPNKYCYTNDSNEFIFLPKSSVELEKLICGKKYRKGVLCGECIDGYGPAVNSPTFDCVNCTDVDIVGNIFKYLAAVYIPIVVIFLVIVLFGVRLTSGPANAFILYAQIISSTFSMDANGQILLHHSVHKTTLQKAYQIPYGVFNLELLQSLIPPLCIGEHLNALSIISLDYIVAIFPLFLIIISALLVMVSSCCFRENLCMQENSVASFFANRRRNLREAILPSIAAFLLLSYTKFSLTTAYILNLQALTDDKGTSLHPSRVYYAGQYEDTDPEYIHYYLIPACFILATFVITPPLLLLHYPLWFIEWCLGKVDCLWRWYPVGKVHLLLDTFQGCFKNRYRFFAGLYFLFRLIININFSFSYSWLVQYILQLIVCTVMVVILALCQPYNKENKIFNYIDVLFFADIAIISALSLYLYEYGKNYKLDKELPNVMRFVFVVQYVLILLPLIYIIVYISWINTKPFHLAIKNFVKQKTQYMKQCLNLPCKGERISLLSQNQRGYTTVTHTEVNSVIEESEEILLRRAEIVNTYKPVQNLPTVAESQCGVEPSHGVSTNVNDSHLKSWTSRAGTYGSSGRRSTSTRSSNGSSAPSQSTGHNTKQSMVE